MHLEEVYTDYYHLPIPGVKRKLELPRPGFILLLFTVDSLFFDVHQFFVDFVGAGEQ